MPVGKDEKDNKEVRRVGTPPKFDFTPKQHFEIGEALGLMDFETAAEDVRRALRGAEGRAGAAGARARRVHARPAHERRSATPRTNPPLLVKDHAAYGTGNLPKFAEDLFQTTNGYWLIPTAEVSLTNLVREQILDEAELPMRVTAWTPCFRSEAGAAGKDTRGMIRQHQFSKVELVSITTPEQSLAEHERMTACAEEVLKRLGLPTAPCCCAPATWALPRRRPTTSRCGCRAQDTYREISSCSVCGDFQARRMDARYRPKGGKDARFVHTLNGSGLAVGRTLVAILENYQQADGSVVIPEALQPYMGGLTKIEKP